MNHDFKKDYCNWLSFREKDPYDRKRKGWGKLQHGSGYDSQYVCEKEERTYAKKISGHLKSSFIKKLGRTFIKGIDLKHICLRGQHLENTNLIEANLYRANLYKATLDGASLNGANLSKSVLAKASLRGADLDHANLEGADFTRVHLEGAYIGSSNMRETKFEPLTLPSLRGVDLIQNLEEVTYDFSVVGLSNLRAALKEASMRETERKITYAIRKKEWEKKKHTSCDPIIFHSDWWVVGIALNTVSAFFDKRILDGILFRYVSDWGLAVSRPLWLLITLGLLSSIIYCILITCKRGCIIRVKPNNIEKTYVGCHAKYGEAKLSRGRKFCRILYFSASQRLSLWLEGSQLRHMDRPHAKKSVHIKG